MKSRVQVLAENLVKWGHPDVVVTHNDPSDFQPLGSYFDVILTDVPCSGEGMFRKDPQSVTEWSEEHVELCRLRQRRIVSDIWPCLKPGGILIYSTCTYNIKEDEENIRWMQQELGAEPLPLEVPPAWGITGNLLADADFPAYRFLPHKTRGEGFFLAVLCKPSDGEWENETGWKTGKKTLKGNRNTKSADAGVLDTARHWLDKRLEETQVLVADANGVRLYPRRFVDDVQRMEQHLRVVLAGLAMGEVKGKDLVPAHALAMSPSVRSAGAFDTVEVDYRQAIAYLRREAVVLPTTASRGYLLLTYRHVPLGFVKNIGNRANNLYPQEWRIRSSYLPDVANVL